MLGPSQNKTNRDFFSQPKGEDGVTGAGGVRNTTNITLFS